MGFLHDLLRGDPLGVLSGGKAFLLSDPMVYLLSPLQLGTAAQADPITETGSEMGEVAHINSSV